MRNSFHLLLFVFFIGTTLSAQVKIGNDPENINPSSILELESTDKVLVITRVTSIQMNAIVPAEGALCYNTDFQTIHYYDGTQWVNSSSLVGTVMFNSIGTDQIIDGSINGVDIQFNSIGPDLLQNYSVTKDKLSDNSVGPDQLDLDEIPVSTFSNDAGYITSTEITPFSTDVDNSISAGTDGGAFYDDTLIKDDILDNTAAINAHVAADDDLSETNELQDLIFNEATGVLTLTRPSTTGNEEDLSSLRAVLNSTASVTVSGTGTTIDPYELEAATTTGDDDQTAAEVKYDNTTSLLTATTTQAAIDEIAAAGSDDDQTAAEVNYDNTTSLLTATTTQAAIDEIAAAGSDDNQTAAEVNYDNTTSLLTATTTQAAIDEIVATETTVTPDDITIEGSGADANDPLKIKEGGISSTEIADDAVTAEKLDQMGATNDQVLVWKADDVDPLVGSWTPSTNTSHTGDPKSIFFADTDGTPTTSPLGGLIWDPEGRRDAYEALYIGLDGNTAVRSPSAKVQIIEGLNNELSYSLQLQNLGNDGNTQTAVGILFSTEGVGNFGKGGLVYQRNNTYGRGDFHFLQDIGDDVFNPNTTDDKAFTIKNNKDIQLYGNLIDKNDVGGTPSAASTENDWVLTNTENGTEWAPAGGLPNATIDGQVLIWDADAISSTEGDWIAGTGNLAANNLTQANENRTYNQGANNLTFTGSGSVGIGNFGGLEPVQSTDKLDVNGQIRARNGFAASPGTANLPSYGFYTNNDNDTGMFRPGEDQIGFSVGGNEAMKIEEPTAGSTKVIINQSLELDGTLLDEDGDAGTAGQVLSSTATGTKWVDPSGPTQKGKVLENEGFGNGTYSVAVNQDSDDYIINTTVISSLGTYFIIQVTNQTATSFEVQIAQISAAGFIPTIADWYYTIYNP